MYACMYVCLYVCVCVCTHICVSVSLYVCLYVCMHHISRCMPSVHECPVCMLAIQCISGIQYIQYLCLNLPASACICDRFIQEPKPLGTCLGHIFQCKQHSMINQKCYQDLPSHVVSRHRSPTLQSFGAGPAPPSRAFCTSCRKRSTFLSQAVLTAPGNQ